MRPSRPVIGSVALSALTAAYILFATNATFWAKAFAYFGEHVEALAMLAAGLFALFLAGLTTVSVKYLIKPLFILLVLIAAAASYYTDTFGTVIDRQMIQNILLTTPGEARHLISPDMALHLLIYGLLPAAFIAAVRIRHRPILSKVRRNSLVIFPALLLAIGIVFANYQAFSGTFRAHRDLMASLNPVAPIGAAVRYADRLTRERNIVAEPLGLDARQSERVARSQKPVVTVFVVGETARAQNFGLAGYARDTTPELRSLNVASFDDVSSCGTSTAVSVPCMFSVYPRADYTEPKALATQNLTDVLSHAGLSVAWYDNDTGSMQVADRMAYEFLPAKADDRYCEGGECLDDVLVNRLAVALDAVKGNSVIVLHQLGSHGPAYSARYPAAFERFKPACHTSQFADCTREEIANAYDNTIAYTDHILAEAIRLLDRHQELATNLLFVSDHGESLGENGLFLHGAPYFMAPDTQTHVPMIAWFSPSYAALVGLDQGCVRNLADAPLSHDNVFHTMLGLSEVSTSAYQPALDMFAACRGRAGGAVAQLPEQRS
ncbi:phosphoethanolamine--lipid A transferase [Aureimonas altamirensis]|uniref:phosphoethanolamine transferase n=1 Tax=Aureimonas altamirensis TaxID=370622 RepID=UPI001E5F789C|nr:phosphoethanolamine--lipid A transferase [Aureimonas altamirensis]UHD44732.1 phosphoethanolamine--lipid A transferase [Aureimonas altamirensis]